MISLMNRGRPERLSHDAPIYIVDVINLLPPSWIDQIRECSHQHSVWRTLGGLSETSREDVFNEDSIAEVGVVTGEVVKQSLPWLDSLYRDTFIKFTNNLTDNAYCTSPDLQAGVNINTTRRNARYEWHVDTNPLTGVLFVTTLAPVDGGQLIFRPDPFARPNENWEVAVSPTLGQLLLFDAREAAHCVTTLKVNERISIPMNYYLQGCYPTRPGDLDAYLYG
jgi:hypothetical protein